MFTKIKISYELQDFTEQFEIDSKSGVLTTKKELDREKQEFYTIKVVAKDGAPSAVLNNGEPNTGTYNYDLRLPIIILGGIEFLRSKT